MINETMISQYVPARKPLTMFREMFAHGSLHHLWARLNRQSFRLLDLDDTLKVRPVEASYHAGIKTVSIDRIRGTQGKAD